MSLLARALARLRGRTLVGGDENGNLYYKWYETVSKAGAGEAASEAAAARGDGERDDASSPGLVVERRFVRTPSGSSPQKFDATTIPPEWSAWLRKTRRDPPSPEEAAANAARRERVRSLAAEIDNRRLLGASPSSPQAAGRGTGEGSAAEAATRSLAEGTEATAAAAAAAPPPPSEPQQQQHASISGAEFEAETWVPPPRIDPDKKGGK